MTGWAGGGLKNVGSCVWGSEGVSRGVRMEVWQVANEGRESGEGGKPQPRGKIWAMESNKYLICIQMIVLAPQKKA